MQSIKRRNMKMAFSMLAVLLFFSCSMEKKIVSSGTQLNKERMVGEKKVKVGIWVEPVDSNRVQIANYVKGLKQGPVKIVYSDGAYIIAEYKDDVRDGKTKYYRSDGVVYREETYKAGDRVGVKSYSPAW